MKQLHHAALIVLITLLAVHTGASQVQIPGTQALKFTSTILGEEFNLSIQLPRFYEDTTRRFPVVYLLDGQWDFPLVNGLTGGQYYDGFIPGIIVVGIGWGGSKPNYDSLRAKDLTPTRVAQMPHSGNGPQFLAFVKKELIPMIESKYRTAKDDRTLVGSSFGGLFTLYALFNETSLFNRYILTSPALDWDNGLIARLESTYYAKTAELPVRLFMATGGLENVPQFQKFADHLKSRNYKGLMLETRVLEGMGHSGSKPEGYNRGLQFVFARPAVTLDPAVLDQYVGMYRLTPDQVFRLTNQSGHLVLIAPDSSKLEWQAESETDFFYKGAYLFLHFKKDDAGKVVGCRLEQFNGEMFVKKED